MLAERQAEQESAAPEYTDFAHTGPGTLAGRYLRRFWQPVYVASALPAGQARPIEVMSEPLTLYRGASGTAQVLASRCAHRGTQLSTGWVEDNCLRCFYHGWKYDQTGQCVEMPAEDPSFPPKVTIKSYPTREYLGLIFAYLGEGEPPLFPPVPPFEGEGLLENETTLWPCNYFQSYENSADEVHVAFVHREGGSHTGIYDVPRVTAEETDYGLVRYGTRANGEVRVTHHVLPNITRVIVPPPLGMEGQGGWRDAWFWWVPRDDEHFYFVQSRWVHISGAAVPAYQAQVARYEARRAGYERTDLVAADILAGKRQIAGLEHPDLVRVQDQVAQVGQGVIQDRTQERLGRSDVAMILLRQLWSRELRALAEGRPLKPWRLTESVAPTLGF